MKRKTIKQRENSRKGLLTALCALVSLCVYGYDWM